MILVDPLLVALYLVYIVILAQWKPHLAPAIPAAELRDFRAQAVKRVTVALIPAFVLIVGVLGSICAGVASYQKLLPRSAILSAIARATPASRYAFLSAS